MDITISAARSEHFASLRDIELAAFETLRKTGAVSGQAMANSLEDFNNFSRDGLLLAAFTSNSTPVGFIAGELCDEWLYVAEMDVHPQWQRQGIGRLLIQTLLSTAQQRDLAGATLTTDILAAFNAKFYATLGFEIVEGHSCPPHLLSKKTEEAEMGLNSARRVAMRLSF